MKQDEKSDKIYIVKNGNLKINIEGCIPYIHNVIFNLLEKSKEKKLFTDEEISFLLKENFENFSTKNISIELDEKFNTKKLINLCILESGEILGAESFIFETNNFFSALVNNKKASIFSIEKKDFQEIINHHFLCRKAFVNFNKNKIISFAKRIKEIIKIHYDYFDKHKKEIEKLNLINYKKTLYEVFFPAEKKYIISKKIYNKANEESRYYDYNLSLFRNQSEEKILKPNHFFNYEKIECNKKDNISNSKNKKDVNFSNKIGINKEKRYFSLVKDQNLIITKEIYKNENFSFKDISEKNDLKKKESNMFSEEDLFSFNKKKIFNANICDELDRNYPEKKDKIFDQKNKKYGIKITKYGLTRNKSSDIDSLYKNSFNSASGENLQHKSEFLNVNKISSYYDLDKISNSNNVPSKKFFFIFIEIKINHIEKRLNDHKIYSKSNFTNFTNINHNNFKKDASNNFNVVDNFSLLEDQKHLNINFYKKSANLEKKEKSVFSVNSERKAKSSRSNGVISSEKIILNCETKSPKIINLRGNFDKLTENKFFKNIIKKVNN